MIPRIIIAFYQGLEDTDFRHFVNVAIHFFKVSPEFSNLLSF